MSQGANITAKCNEVEVNTSSVINSSIAQSNNNKILANEPAFDGTVANYIQRVGKFKFLTKEEEQVLLTSAQNNDDAAIELLIKSHLRLVVKIAFEYYRYGLPMMDLIAEGNVGLVRAVQKFDRQKGSRLASYAMWWIRAMIQNFILKSWSIVKIASTNAERKLFFSLQKIKSHLGIRKDEYMMESDVNRVASYAGVNKKAVKTIEGRVFAKDVSADQLVPGSNYNIIDTIESEECSPEMTLVDKNDKERLNNALQVALSRLSEREQKIVRMRFQQQANGGGSGTTLESIGKCFGISSERVRQIANRAIEKLKEFMSDHDCNINVTYLS